MINVMGSFEMENIIRQANYWRRNAGVYITYAPDSTGAPAMVVCNDEDFAKVDTRLPQVLRAIFTRSAYKQHGLNPMLLDATLQLWREQEIRLPGDQLYEEIILTRVVSIHVEPGTQLVKLEGLQVVDTDTVCGMSFVTSLRFSSQNWLKPEQMAAIQTDWLARYTAASGMGLDMAGVVDFVLQKEASMAEPGLVLPGIPADGQLSI